MHVITVFKISDHMNYYKNLGGWSTAFGGLTEKAGTAFGAAKTKMANSFSHQNLSDEAVKVSLRFFNSFKKWLIVEQIIHQKWKQYQHENLNFFLQEYESSKQMSGATNGSDPVTKQPIAEEK